MESTRNETLKEILDSLETTFIKASKYIIKNISNHQEHLQGLRGGDFSVTLDEDVYGLYGKALQNFKSFYICEEVRNEFPQGRISIIDLENCEFLIILDSIDGTVNMLHDLPFGVNIAVCPFYHGKKVYTIGDIKAVFVGDYRSQKSYKWISGSDLQITSPLYQNLRMKKHQDEVPKVFEVPDECSYIKKNDDSLETKQLELLRIFRKIFKDCQRRAVDCTGLRMLEVLDQNLIAYGDVRKATSIWDTLPSMRLLLEAKDYRILDGSFNKISLESPFLIRHASDFVIQNTLTESVIILNEKDASSFFLKLNTEVTY